MLFCPDSANANLAVSPGWTFCKVNIVIPEHALECLTNELDVVEYKRERKGKKARVVYVQQRTLNTAVDRESSVWQGKREPGVPAVVKENDAPRGSGASPTVVTRRNSA